MKEILFRGKTKETHEWVYGGYCKMDDRRFIVQRNKEANSWGMFEVGPYTVGQFIGKVDRNGRLIFEGDLCLVTIPGYPYLDEESIITDPPYMKLGKCVRDLENTGFYSENKVGEPYKWWNLNDMPDTYCGLVEVVGNIYDNPDYICPVCGEPWNSKRDTEGKEPCRACGEFI